MTKWAVVTVALYMLLLAALSFPLFAAFGAETHDDPLGWDTAAAVEAYGSLGYWVVIGILGLSQALLLFVPVRSRQDITIKQRHILVPLVTASFFMGLLVAAALMSVIVAIFADNAPDAFEWSEPAAWVLAWVVWFVVFRRFRLKAENAESLVNRVTAWLYRGSIAELVVAVGCHIVVRRRGDCSAPVGTFIGICAGIAVLFLSFGPGVFYLFAARRERMLPKSRRGDEPEEEGGQSTRVL